MQVDLTTERMSSNKYSMYNTICIVIEYYDRTEIKPVHCNNKCERIYITF